MKKIVLFLLATLFVVGCLGSVAFATELKILSEGIVPTTTFEEIIPEGGSSRLPFLTNGKTEAAMADCTDFNFKIAEGKEDAAFAEKFGKGETDLDAAGCGTLGIGADAYVEFDLGAVCKLSKYRVYNYQWGPQYCMNKAWKLVVSADGKDWKEVHAASGNTEWVEYNEYSFDAVDARYVRLCVTELYIGGSKSPVQKMRLYEVQLFGTGTPAAVETTAAPAATTAAPSATAAATTKAPASTTKAPAATTKAPATAAQTSDTMLVLAAMVLTSGVIAVVAAKKSKVR